MSVYTKTPPPHIHSGESVRKIYWRSILFLAPAFLFLIIPFGWNVLRLAAVNIAAACLAELLARKLLSKKQSISDGNSLLTALLFTMILPPTLPTWMAGIGAFTAIFLGKEFLGGLGSYPFSPALIGRALLLIGFPAAMNNPAMIESSGIAGMIGRVLIVLGGFLIVSNRMLYWEIPVIYLAGVIIFSSPSFLTAPLIAFFILSDFSTLPSNRPACRIYTLFAVLATIGFQFLWPRFLDAATFAILLLSASNGLLERMIPLKLARKNKNEKKQKAITV